MIMKKKVEITEDSKSFERFETLLQKVVSVAKKELDERQKTDRKEKEVRKARKS